MILSNINGIEGLVGLIASGLAIITTFAIVVRWLLHNAIGPIASKVMQHDTDIASLWGLANSTNIKASRIEGFLAGMGKTKLPEVEPTVEVPINGEIVEKPLL